MAVVGDYSGSTFYGAYSGNYTAANRPTSNKIDKIVIHVMQGSWSSAINWFNDSRSGVSCHYNVRSSDGFIGQSVREDDIAYHAGYWPYNQTSVGIEHEGYTWDPSKWFTDAMYRSSARLSAYLCKKYGIPIDRSHIIGHYQVPGCSSGGGAGCHTDPGGGWNWDKYMSYVRSYAAPPYTFIVGNRTPGRFSASGNWGTSSYSTQRYGADYHYSYPKAVADPAQFKIKLPARGNYAVYAWWPDDPGYNGSAPFGIYTTSGFRYVRVDQRRNGGRWNYLGTFNMPAGDSWYVRVSRQTTTRGEIIADAVKIVRR